MQYQRFVSYIYHYHGQQKLENTGFVKVERKGNYVRFSIRTKIVDSENVTFQLGFVSGRRSGDFQGVLVAEEGVKQGEFTYQIVTKCDQIAGRNIQLSDICGIIIKGSMQHSYMTIWEDLSLTPDMVEWIEANKREEWGQEAITIEAKQMMQDACENDELTSETAVCEEREMIQEEGEVSPGLNYLFQKRGRLPLFEGGELYDCIRIEPQDIGLLEMKFWKYGSNSFLSHGYYRYHYLMLGKMRFQDEEERIILGVPSIFCQKEKELANLFGFEQFVSLKRTDKKQGEFGYWIVEL